MENIKIFVAGHKKFDYIKNDLIFPIQTGTAISGERLPNILHDDHGDNISHKNRSYSEMTAQYWVWKNVEADYYGFMHYRRYFNFSEKIYPMSGYSNVFADKISDSNIKKFGWDEDSIRKCINGYDIISTIPQDTKEVQGLENVYQQYCKAEYLYEKDLRIVMSIINEKYPEFKDAANSYIYGHMAIFCNMYILKKQIFFDYCDWLFDILSEFEKRVNMDSYNTSALRTPGHLAERLFGIYYTYLKQNKNIRIRELQKVWIDNTSVPDIEFEKKNTIPIVFSTDDNYLPYLGVALQSLIDCSSEDKKYQVVVMHTKLSPSNQYRLERMSTSNIKITCKNISNLIKGIPFSSNIDYITVETFYRFIIPDLFPTNDKIIYLDADLVLLNDIANLFEQDIGDCVLGAVRQINNYQKIDQIKKLLDIPFYDYFNAGVLLINIKRFIEEDIKDKAFSLIKAGKNYPTGDQDILNVLCNGMVRYLDERWNWPGPHFEWLNDKDFPAKYLTAYKTAAENPHIIHYLTSAKPWQTPEKAMSKYFWHYARKSEFYEEVLYNNIILNINTKIKDRDSNEHLIKNSRSYKIGRIITYFPRKVRGLIHCYKDNGYKYTINLLLKKITKRLSIK